MGTRMMVVSAALILGLAACGGDSSDDSGSGDAPEAPTSSAPPEEEAQADTGTACSLATPDMVSAAFGGSAAEGVEGAARNCTFAITGGSAASVSVFHYGSSSDWEGVRQGYEDNRSGTTDVAGVGEEAFNPADVGVYELVVRSGDVVFDVAVLSGPDSPDIPGDIVELATAIASSQS